MKIVTMNRDYDYRPTLHRLTAYKANCTYRRVPEAAATAIVEAGAGVVVAEIDEALVPNRWPRVVG